MENRNIPKREEKLWSEIKNYQVATNNARILGVLSLLSMKKQVKSWILQLKLKVAVIFMLKELKEMAIYY